LLIFKIEKKQKNRSKIIKREFNTQQMLWVLIRQINGNCLPLECEVVGYKDKVVELYL